MEQLERTVVTALMAPLALAAHLALKALLATMEMSVRVDRAVRLARLRNRPAAPPGSAHRPSR
jgi:hypothetical protein